MVLQLNIIQMVLKRVIPSSKKENNIGEDFVQCIQYYANNQVKTKKCFANGLANGEYVTHYDNGSVDCKGNYKNGLKDGVFIIYSKEGFIKSEKTFENGIKNGKLAKYTYGKLKTLINYTNGLQNGKCVKPINIFTDIK